MDSSSTSDLRLIGALLTKCRSGGDRRRAGLVRLQLSVIAATRRNGTRPLPLRSENAKTACIMGVFVVSRRRIRDLLTRLTGFRGDRLTRQVDHGKSAFG